MHVVCSHCRTVNRVPDERAAQDPVCGHCGRTLLDGHPVELTDDNFDAVISRSDLPIVVDFWDYSVFDDPRFWSEDRLHLNPVGHQRVAMAVLERLGQPLPGPWDAPLPQVRPPSPLQRAGRNAAWAGKHFAPWIGRRFTGRSSGDNISAKRPECTPVRHGG